MPTNTCQRPKCGKKFYALEKRQKFCSGSCGAKNRFENPPPPKVEKEVKENEWWRTFGKEALNVATKL